MPFRAWVTFATDPPLRFPLVLLAAPFAIRALAMFALQRQNDCGMTSFSEAA